MRRREPTPEELVPVQEVCYVVVRTNEGWKAGVLLVYEQNGKKSLNIRWYKKVEPMRRLWVDELHKRGDLPVATSRSMLRHVFWKKGIRGIDPKVVFGLEGT